VFAACRALNTSKDIADLKAKVTEVKSDIKSLREDISTMLNIIQTNIIHRNLPVNNYNDK
jgi:peptidoglycan hydrolase CwlO-like protein